MICVVSTSSPLPVVAQSCLSSRRSALMCTTTEGVVKSSRKGCGRVQQRGGDKKAGEVSMSINVKINETLLSRRNLKLAGRCIRVPQVLVDVMHVDEDS